MHLLKTEKGRKCSFFTKQKTRTGQNVFSSPGGVGGGGNSGFQVTGMIEGVF